jgi:hypothetical protein
MCGKTSSPANGVTTVRTKARRGSLRDDRHDATAHTVCPAHFSQRENADHPGNTGRALWATFGSRTGFGHGGGTNAEASLGLATTGMRVVCSPSRLLRCVSSAPVASHNVLHVREPTNRLQEPLAQARLAHGMRAPIGGI